MVEAPHPTAAVLIIGAEVLSGKVADENGPFLIRALRERGIDLLELRILDDAVATIAAAIRQLRERATYIFTTGGIGPTHDDVTIAAVAEALERPIVRDPGLEARIRDHFGDRLNPARLRLANVPQGARVTLAAGGILPVIHAENVWLLPGVPSLMRMCFEAIDGQLGRAPMFTQGLLLNRSETELAAHLGSVQQSRPQVAIGSYPRFDSDAAGYRVKVTVDGRDEAAVRDTVELIREGLEEEWIVGEI